MFSSLYFQISALCYIILLAIVFFSKKRLNLLENKIYSFLIVANIIGLIIDIISTYIALVNVENMYLNFICKLYLIYLLSWFMLFTFYVFVISSKKKNDELRKVRDHKKGLTFLIVVYIITMIMVFVLPLYNFSENGIIYTYGPSANMLYGVAGLFILLCIACLAIRIKEIKQKKYIPIFALIIIGTLVMTVQAVIPELLLLTAMESFVTFLMFFTIENPDVKMINELNLLKEKAEKANQAKSDFLSNMSHEIRTPLNAIAGFSQAIIEEEDINTIKDEAKDIVVASNNLIELVNGILDISKIEANKLEIVNTNYDAYRLFREIETLIRGRLGDKPLEFKVTVDPSMPRFLYGDSVRLKQVVINFLTNAVKYTRHGFVDFRVQSVISGDICRLIISVQDTGLGIKKEDIDKLFTKFTRLDMEKNKTAEGTGLGLAITKSIVDMMGGKIVVQSEYTRGSKFTVALDQKVVVDVSDLEMEDENEEFIPFSAPNRKVLIVDDNKMNIKVATTLLKKYNLIIESLMSGGECIEKISSGEKYDLILLDDMMPVMSGVETLKRLKLLSNYNIPTVALTANAITGMEEKYLADGFDGYLSKPMNRYRLHLVLEKYCSNNSSDDNINMNQLNKDIDLSDKKILIVDDNNINIKVATMLIKKYNPIIDTAMSGQDCIDKILSGEKYDLILMDDMMPMMDGTTTLHKLKEIPEYTIPTIMFTANAIEGMKEKYLEAGFSDYLTKPIDREELERVFRSFINNIKN